MIERVDLGFHVLIAHLDQLLGTIHAQLFACFEAVPAVQSLFFSIHQAELDGFYYTVFLDVVLESCVIVAREKWVSIGMGMEVHRSLRKAPPAPLHVGPGTT